MLRVSNPSHRTVGYTGVVLLITLFLLLAYSHRRTNRFERLASSGEIENNAPVRASSEIAIHASPVKVWHVLSDIDRWPTWQPNISVAKINGSLQTGTTFSFTYGGSKIESRIALVRPDKQLGWTGTTFGATAIHVWNLQPLPGGGTLVKTEESLDGLLLRLKLFYSSKDLAKSHQLWLEALKHKTEE